MGKKKTFYFNDDDLEVFEQVRQYAGDSLSSIVTDAFREYLKKRQLEEQQMMLVHIWRGTVDCPNDFADKEQFRFVGRKLSSAKRREGPDAETEYTLYLTKKRQYLVFWYEYDNVSKVERAGYYPPAKNLIDLRDKSLPESLIAEAEKVMGVDHYVDLDI